MAANKHTYKYEGVRFGASTPLYYEDERYELGDEIDLGAGEHQRLSAYFNLNPVGEVPKSRQEAADQPAQTAGASQPVAQSGPSSTSSQTGNIS